MLIFTFPNSPNQLTVSRNPYLQNVRCNLDGRLIPDKEMSTIDREFAEMELNALGFNTFFNASKSFLNAIAPRDVNPCNVAEVQNEDDSDFMFIIDLERNGRGITHDGYSKDNAQINLDATYIEGNLNSHYHEADIENLMITYISEDADITVKKYKLRQYPVQIFAVCDAYWIFNSDGGDFIKDYAAVELVQNKEMRIRMQHSNLI